MNTSFRIRPLTAADLPAVMRIEQVSYSTPWPESSFQGLLNRTDTALFVAEVEQSRSDGGADVAPTPVEIAGYAVCWAVFDQGELGNIAVAPAWRHQGVARLLLERVIRTMRERGVRELYLEVRLTNKIAQHLYRAYGFREVGIRRAYYSNPTEDALVMRLGLGPDAGDD